MKRVRKGPEPANLAAFKKNHPNGTWEDFRRNRNRYKESLNQLFADQHKLCAYCEREIHADDDNHRIEHFHPKSDTSTEHNWALDWNNMLAVCIGGESKEDKKAHKLPKNLSCDSHKNHLCNDPKIAEKLAGYANTCLLNPLDLPHLVNLFCCDITNGHLSPDIEACRLAGVNVCKLACTIHAFNLNCNRLAKARLNVSDDIQVRMNIVETLEGFTEQERMDMLLKEYFGDGLPEYFTTYRCCLGHAAEKYLRSINYNG